MMPTLAKFVDTKNSFKDFSTYYENVIHLYS